MSLDLSQFLQSFFEECSESLDSTERSLLNLELSGDNTDAIDTIFRGAHSIKGASATFAFNDVASFTHAMETLLDRIRDGRKSIIREDVDLLLASVDCVRSMLAAKQSGGDIDAARVNELQVRLKSALDEKPKPVKAKLAPPKPASDEITDDEFESLLDSLHGKSGAASATAGKADWRIVFRPHPKVMKNGSDPIRIFRVLESLGELRVTADDSGLPAFADLNPEECHLRWTLELTSQAAREQIEEAFAWVKGDAELEIVRLAIPGEPPAGALRASNFAPGEIVMLKEEKKTPAAELAAVNMESPAAPVMSAAQAASTARTAASSAGQEGTSIRVSIDKVDALINMVGELVITQLMLHQQSKRLDLRRHPGMQQSLSQLDRNTRELQESVMRIRMLPISFAFNRFPRLVHDLTQKLGKKVELKMTGESTELDKTVMEKIGDPLVHLVRNSLDHGLERPEVRRAAGKPETGTLHLNAYHQGGNIVIEIADDGAGLPRGKILKKAKERGLIGDERSLTDDKIHELIFMPGFSTAEQVSDVSGRGVGMDVVRKNIKALGGTVEIASREGRGTTITIRLPLTLAILDGQSVRVGDENYIIPLVSIVESVKVRKEMVCVVAGKAEIIRLREDYLPVLRLYQVFDTEPRTRNLFDGLLVIVEGEGMKAGLFVDQLLGQQQVVIKSIETNFRHVDSFSGATILGDGTVALILDIPGLIKLAREKIDPDEIERLHQGEHLAA